MSVLIPWKSQVYDSLPFNGKGEYSFFYGQPIDASDIDLAIEEMEVVRFLIQQFPNWLVELCEMPKTTKIRAHLVEHFTRRDQVPGDIDLLLYDSSSPQHVAAIEVKVFKKRQAVSHNNFLDNIYKKMDKGMKQAKGLIDIGFHRVFLMPIILANTSNDTESNLASRNVLNSNWGKIRAAHDHRNTNRDVGLIAVELDQTTARPIYEAGNVSGFLFSEYRQKQNPYITNMIKQGEITSKNHSGS